MSSSFTPVDLDAVLDNLEEEEMRRAMETVSKTEEEQHVSRQHVDEPGQEAFAGRPTSTESELAPSMMMSSRPNSNDVENLDQPPARVEREELEEQLKLDESSSVLSPSFNLTDEKEDAFNDCSESQIADVSNDGHDESAAITDVEEQGVSEGAVGNNGGSNGQSTLVSQVRQTLTISEDRPCINESSEVATSTAIVASSNTYEKIGCESRLLGPELREGNMIHVTTAQSEGVKEEISKDDHVDVKDSVHDNEDKKTSHTNEYEEICTMDNVQPQGLGESREVKEEMSPARSDSPPFQSIYKEGDDNEDDFQTTPNEKEPQSTTFEKVTNCQTTEVQNHDLQTNSEEQSVTTGPLCNGNGSDGTNANDQADWTEVPPQWVPDEEAPVCMGCGTKFNLVKRRHHCRACGRVLCGNCCGEKAVLAFTEGKPARVCKPCKERHEELVHRMQSPRASAMRRTSLVTNRTDSAASASTPTSPARTSEPKQVMFSDGIRPGGELTELDDSLGNSTTPRRSSSSSGRSSRRSRRSFFSRPFTDSAQCLLPSDRSLLPPKLERKHEKGELDGVEEEQVFLVNKHLRVHVLLTLYKPIAKEVWFFRTEGMATVGQDDLAFLLKRLMDEQQPPRDIFDLIQAVYKSALLGSPILDLSYVEAPCENFLGRSDLAGFLFFRHTFQSLEGLHLKNSDQLLFGWLFTKWELPWAKLFPLRLLLRLGAETRYYPTPLWCSRDRAHVYKDVANTIMKLLCDFRNYAYALPVVQGLHIHMENKRTTIALPNERYREIVRALNKSNDFVLALGASFSRAADSHLVAIQREEFTASASDYETQAISMINSDRKMTGASFVIFNGALKSSSGLKAKCSIVEDGIMIQVEQERMLAIRKSLEKMDDFTIECGPLSSPEPDEVVEVMWTNSPIPTNQGVRSHVDGRSMRGVPSVKLHLGRDFVHERARLLIRWTEVFLLHTSDPEGPDPMTAASLLAKAICSLLVGHLKALKACGILCLALRVDLHPDKIGFEAGSGGCELAQDWLNILDAGLVPIIHGGNISGQQALSVELVFYILDA